MYSRYEEKGHGHGTFGGWWGPWMMMKLVWGLLAWLLVSAVLMWAWNTLLPYLAGLPSLEYAHALALAIGLAVLRWVFGRRGHHGWGHGYGHCGHYGMGYGYHHHGAMGCCCGYGGKGASEECDDSCCEEEDEAKGKETDAPAAKTAAKRGQPRAAK